MAVRRWARAAAVVLSCAFLGAAINTCVALVIWNAFPAPPQAWIGASPYRGAWPAGTPADWPSPSGLLSGRSRGYEFGRWSVTRPNCYATAETFGWPWATFARSRWDMFPNPTNLPAPTRAIIWAGAAAGTAVYAMGVGLFPVSACLMRWHARRRARCCIACGYEVADLKRCPECGTERPLDGGRIGLAPPQRVAVWRGHLVLGLVIEAFLMLLLAATLRWCIECKMFQHLYLGLWEGRLCLGRFAERWQYPGVHAFRYDFRFELWFTWDRSAERVFLAVPLWLMVLGAGPYPAWAWWKVTLWRARRNAPGEVAAAVCPE